MHLNKFRTYLPLFLPILPIICIGVALLFFAVSIEFGRPQISQVMPTTPATLAVGATATIGAQTAEVGTPAFPTVTAPASAPAAFAWLNREQVVTALKDISLVVASGIITLTSVYIVGLIQSVTKQEEEMREKRRTRTRHYEEYIHWLLKIGQHSDLLEKYPDLKQILPEKGRKFIISEETIQEVIENMPLAYDLFPIDDMDLKNAVNSALDAAIGVITDIYSGREPDYSDVRTKYIQALKELENYEKNMA